jgi:hypothetical protein
MKTYKEFLPVIVLLVFLLFGCNRPECKNQNPIFDTYAPDLKDYKTELAKQLSAIDKSKLRYWLKSFNETDKVGQLLFYVQGEGLCAEIELTVNDWYKLELVREKKGVSFCGAEFKKLQYEIVKNDSVITFVYKDFDRIID